MERVLMGLGSSKPTEKLIYDLYLLIHFFNTYLLHTYSIGFLLKEDGTYSSSIFFPKQEKHDPASGPLHWLILLLGMSFPKISS